MSLVKLSNPTSQWKTLMKEKWYLHIAKPCNAVLSSWGLKTLAKPFYSECIILVVFCGFWFAGMALSSIHKKGLRAEELKTGAERCCVFGSQVLTRNGICLASSAEAATIKVKPCWLRKHLKHEYSSVCLRRTCSPKFWKIVKIVKMFSCHFRYQL